MLPNRKHCAGFVRHKKENKLQKYPKKCYLLDAYWLQRRFIQQSQWLCCQWSVFTFFSVISKIRLKQTTIYFFNSFNYAVHSRKVSIGESKWKKGFIFCVMLKRCILTEEELLPCDIVLVFSLYLLEIMPISTSFLAQQNIHLFGTVPKLYKRIRESCS